MVAAVPTLRMEIVKRTDDMKGFVVLPRRRVAERTFSWLGRNRRLAKDWENLAEALRACVTSPRSNPASAGSPAGRLLSLRRRATARYSRNKIE